MLDILDASLHIDAWPDLLLPRDLAPHWSHLIEWEETAIGWEPQGSWCTHRRGKNAVEPKDILSTQSGPTPLQTEIAQGFFELPESESFAVHDGLALSALGVTTHPFDDID